MPTLDMCIGCQIYDVRTVQAPPLIFLYVVIQQLGISQLPSQCSANSQVPFIKQIASFTTSSTLPYPHILQHMMRVQLWLTCPWDEAFDTCILRCVLVAISLTNVHLSTDAWYLIRRCLLGVMDWDQQKRLETLPHFKRLRLHCTWMHKIFTRTKFSTI